MTDQPEAQEPDSANSVTNVSGGVNAKAERIDIGADVVGRDKVVHIEHYHVGGEEAPSKPQVYHNLPQPDYGQFIGREKEFAQVLKILRPYPHSQYPIVTIDGIGGIGKSALALEVAHYYLRDFDELPVDERFEAIIWTSAKQTLLTADGIVQRRQTLRTLADIYMAIAIALHREDILHARSDEQPETVRNALTQQRTLLVVDNLETVDDEAVMEFLRELPAPTKAIVTTRHRLDVAFPVRLHGMPFEDARPLIVQETEKKGVVLSEDDLRHLYERTGGVPLAIVWSVAQMGYGYTVKSVLTRLGQPNNDVARFCFEAAISGLGGNSAGQLLLVLSLFATDVSRDALGQIAGLPELDRDDGLVTLEKLSLVNKSGGRFSLLPLTQLFATNQLKQVPENESRLRGSFIKYFLEFCKANGGEQWRSYGKLDADLKNIQLAVEWAYQLHMWREVGDFATALAEFLDRRGLWNELVEYSTMAVESGYELNDKHLIMKHKTFGLGWVKVVRFQEIEAGAMSIQEGKQLALELGDQRQYAIALRDEGVVHYRRREYEVAKDLLQQSYEIFTAIGDRRWAIRTLGSMGSNEGWHGNEDKALDYYNQSLKESEEIGDTEQVALDLRRIGSILEKRGQIDEARVKLKESLQLHERLNLVHSVAVCCHALARLEFVAGNYGVAKEYAQRSLSLFRQWKWEDNGRKVEELLTRIEEVGKGDGIGDSDKL